MDDGRVLHLRERDLETTGLEAGHAASYPHPAPLEGALEMVDIGGRTTSMQVYVLKRYGYEAVRTSAVGAPPMVATGSQSAISHIQ